MADGLILFIPSVRLASIRPQKKNQRKMIGQHLVGLIRASINTRGPKSVYEKASQHKYTWTISSLELELASIRLTWTVQSIKTRAHVQISTRTVHGKGQCADMCTNMVHQLSKISTRTVREKDQHADMCGQRADMCIDGQYSWAKITRAVHRKG